MTNAVTTSPSGVSLEIYRNLFSALAEEMGAALRRAAHSPNIKERRDYSCALFSPQGQPVAMGDHMPVHLGAMPMSVAKALEILGTLAAGDVACVNDPFQGGTHLPDITLVSPVFMGEILLGYVASRAHHADVGGIAPGSMPLAREIVQEGLRIPPVRLVREGIMEADLLRLILANVRTPEERRGDLEAQLASLHTGSRRLLEMAERRGAPTVLKAMDDLLEYADRLLGEGLAQIPPGRYSGEDWMEDDGFGHGPVRIQVEVTVLPEGRAVVDFHGSSPQVPGGINAVGAITHSATRYVLRCLAEALLGLPLPAGGGSMERVELRLPPGSVVNARFPASVAAGNVETSQRITDVLFRALAPALPHLVPALSQGTMNNLTVGGLDTHGRPFAYYETAGGGMGGGPQGPGLSGVHTHMSNSLNTPIEALEHAYPFRLTRYGIRKGSGGGGEHPGGDGLERELELLVDATVTILSERREKGPSGLAGGEAGAPGQNALRRNGVEQPLPGKVTLEAHAGDVIVIRSPGGGGWGSPTSEPPMDP